MELGDQTTDERMERSPLDMALDALDAALNGLIDTVEAGGFDQLAAAEKIAWWQHFETSRNRLPLIDHSLIADAEASNLAKTYCFSTLTQFLMRMFQLSHGEAVHGSGPRQRLGLARRCWGSGWSRCCRSWPLCNGKGL